MTSITSRPVMDNGIRLHANKIREEPLLKLYNIFYSVYSVVYFFFITQNTEDIISYETL